VLFRACLSEPPLMPDADADQLLDGMVLTFREVP
jgi:hypothetical protein